MASSSTFRMFFGLLILGLSLNLSAQSPVEHRLKRQAQGTNDLEVFPGWNPAIDSVFGSSSTSSTTASPAPTADPNCLTNCPVLPQYNPVCGNNGITYSNEARLDCARNCGIAVTMVRYGNCRPASG